MKKISAHFQLLKKVKCKRFNCCFFPG